ncbi:MAG: hypothetical protein Q7J98_11090 [Kiritimatiellia bacterium]|nr:hypothetical protein [Kiritimatiellia bacterium]
MLKNSDKKYAVTHFGAKVLSIRGQRFNNSAAKFWSALIDELTEEYKDCRGVVLEAVNEGNLNPALLFPERELEHELNLLSTDLEDIRAVWQKALEDFELYGPPGAVSMKFFSDSGEMRQIALPMDCVDAEIFLYLLAWLLEWSDLPTSTWNEPEVKGSFLATDPARGFKYNFDFTVEHAPLKEGLFTWRLSLRFERSHVICPSFPRKRESSTDFSLDSHFHGNDKL